MFVPDPPFIPPPPPFVPPPIIPPAAAVAQPTAWGSNIQFVTCTWCGRRFCYRLTRAVAAGSQQDAETRLQRVLQLECDAIPCPQCGSYQPEMVRLLKRQHRSGLWLTGLLLLAVGAAVCGVLFGLGVPWWPVAMVVPVGGLGMLLVRLGLVRRYDPNAPAGSDARKASGQQAEIHVPPSSGPGTHFVVTPDGKVSDLRHMNIQSIPSP